MTCKRYIFIAALIALCTTAALPGTAAAESPGGSFTADLQCRKAWLPWGFNQAEAHSKSPVLIVGGTLASEIVYWLMEARLLGDSYTTYFFQLHHSGGIDINENAAYLKSCVDAVLADRGAQKVHLIGHSQGGVVARTYIHTYGNENKVESMISLAAPHKGTEVVDINLHPLMALLFGCYESALHPIRMPCIQMAVNSTLLQTINVRPAGDPIYYTNISTTNDAFIVPYTNGQMSNCNRTNTLGETLACNVTVQQQCANRWYVDHVLLATDGAVYTGIKKALMHRPPTLDCGVL